MSSALIQAGTLPSALTGEISTFRRSKRLENAKFVSLYNTNRRRPSTLDPSTPRRAPTPLPPSKTKSRALASSRPPKTLLKKQTRKATHPSTTLLPIKRKRISSEPYQAPEADIVMNFAFHDQSLGVLTCDLYHNSTPGWFFNNVSIGWDVLGGDEFRTKNAGVVVDIEGLMTSIVIPWRNPEGFERLMGLLDRMRYGKRGLLHVDVRCVWRI